MTKLKQRGLVGKEENDALLYTVTGREYITESQLRKEVKRSVDDLGGRVSLAELPPLLDVDIVHCEKAAKLLSREGKDAKAEIRLIDGDLLTERYFDELSVELNESLQQKGHVTIGETAKLYDLSADLVTKTVESKIGTVIQGEIQSGLIYTPSYIARVKSIVRGILRGAVAPLSLKAACARLHVHEVALNALIPQIVSSLVKDLEVRGTYQNGSMIWTPDLYGKMQEEKALSFFKSNGYVEYETLKKLGIEKPREYLKDRFPDAYSLETVFASSSVLPPLDAAIDDCISSGAYIDMAVHLPSPFSSVDVQDIVKLSPKVKQIVSSGVGVLMADTCFVSKFFVDKCQTMLKDKILKRAKETMELKKLNKMTETKKNGNGKKEKNSQVAVREEDSDDDWDVGRGKKGKKGRKAGKGSGKSKKSGKASTKDSQKKGNDQDEANTLPSLSNIGEFLKDMDDELEYMGEDVTLLDALSSHFIHFAQNEHKEALKQTLKADAEDRRVISEALSSSLIKRAHQLSLYSKSLHSLFPEGDSDQGQKEEEEEEEENRNEERIQLDRHIVRNVALVHVDEIMKLSALQAFNIGQDLGDEVNEITKSKRSLTDKERLSIAKALPEDISKSAVNLVSTIQKKTLTDALPLLEDALSELCGKRTPKLDKKLEQKIVKDYSSELLVTLHSNQSLTSTIAIAVPLLFACKKSFLLNIPGKLLSFTLGLLKEVVEESDFQLLEELHKKTVSYIQKSSRKNGSEEELSELEADLEQLSSKVKERVSSLTGSA